MKYDKYSNHTQSELASLKLLCTAFAEAMYERLKAKFNQGYRGWDDPHRGIEEIIHTVQQEVELGDPVDAANYCAFMWNKLETTPREASA